MTQTTATAPARFIPATGLTAPVNGTQVSAFWVNGAGWKVQVRTDGRTVVSQLHQHEHQAVAAYNALVAEHTPVAEPVTTAPALAPAAKGTVTKVSDPGHTALAVAELNGFIARGGQLGQASVKTLNALAKRGYLTRTTEMHGLRKVVTGGVITNAGRVRLGQLTEDDREAARIAAAVARPAAQLVNA